MQRISRWITFILSFAYLMAFASIASASDTAKVGVLFHLTGDLAQFGQIQKRSLLIAISIPLL